MRFLRRRDRPADGADGDESPAPLEGVTIFGTDGVADAFIEPTPRLSDDLNGGANLRVRFGATGESADSWQTVHADDVVAVGLAPHAEPSRHRMARRRHVVELEAPPYRISGTAHMPHGADPSRYARSTSHRWLALTGAVIATASESFELDVLLVNLDHVLRF